MQPLTRTEQLAFDLCTKSCLSFWSHNNPRLPNGKELCDVLIVFGEHLLIFSVKEIGLSSTADREAARSRWHRKAVEKSVFQIYGAEKSLSSMSTVIRSDGTNGSRIPKGNALQVHRIAVACGADGLVPVHSTDFGKGFVHVFDETSLMHLLGELDTTKELTDYLSAKERLCTSVEVQCDGPEGNLLAFYLMHNRAFQVLTAKLHVEDGIWQAMQSRPEFVARKNADKISYEWDGMIEFIASKEARTPGGPPLELNQKELVIRGMAEETRVHRRGLAIGLAEFLRDQHALKSRIMLSDQETIYVFCHFPEERSEADCVGELIARCSASRSKTGGRGKKAIGLGFKTAASESGLQISVSYVDFDKMSEEDFEEMKKLADEAGFYPFEAQVKSYQEFPDPEANNGSSL